MPGRHGAQLPGGLRRRGPREGGARRAVLQLLPQRRQLRRREGRGSRRVLRRRRDDQGPRPLRDAPGAEPPRRRLRAPGAPPRGGLAPARPPPPGGRLAPRRRPRRRRLRLPLGQVPLPPGRRARVPRRAPPGRVRPRCAGARTGGRRLPVRVRGRAAHQGVPRAAAAAAGGVRRQGRPPPPPRGRRRRRRARQPQEARPPPPALAQARVHARQVAVPLRPRGGAAGRGSGRPRGRWGGNCRVTRGHFLEYLSFRSIWLQLFFDLTLFWGWYFGQLSERYVLLCLYHRKWRGKLCSVVLALGEEK